MTARLIPVTIPSIYSGRDGNTVNLPVRMALATPDTARAIYAIRDAVEARGGVFRLSDLYRDSEAQERAYMDHKEGRKAAYSPPAGGSWHETGRAFDVDVEALKPLAIGEFRAICGKHGVTPIESESWHFECRASHAIITDRQGYKAGVESALLALGVRVPRLHGRQLEASIQADLHRLGADPGKLDGIIGKRTKEAITDVGMGVWGDMSLIRSELDKRLVKAFPGEYANF